MRKSQQSQRFSAQKIRSNRNAVHMKVWTAFFRLYAGSAKSVGTSWALLQTAALSVGTFLWALFLLSFFLLVILKLK